LEDSKRRKMLADFLKVRRARLSPEDVGLPERHRRRTPGLRREEVAQLAHISPTWYTRLEQGRDVKVSEQVLENIASALRLGSEEREHLFRLARKPPPEPLSAAAEVSPGVRGLLDSLDLSSPAWVLDWRWNILAWNRAAEEIFGNFGALPSGERNIIRLLFADEGLRRLLNWEEFARSMLAAFRSSYDKYADDPWLARFVEDLRAFSPEFREWWVRHDVRSAPIERVRIERPGVGILELDNLSFRVTSKPDQRLCVFTTRPGSESADKIKQLIGSAVSD
jgi:transcriptional regulator with XRE-family HTH domain